MSGNNVTYLSGRFPDQLQLAELEVIILCGFDKCNDKLLTVVNVVNFRIVVLIWPVLDALVLQQTDTYIMGESQSSNPLRTIVLNFVRP